MIGLADHGNDMLFEPDSFASDNGKRTIQKLETVDSQVFR